MYKESITEESLGNLKYTLFLTIQGKPDYTTPIASQKISIVNLSMLLSFFISRWHLRLFVKYRCRELMISFFIFSVTATMLVEFPGLLKLRPRSTIETAADWVECVQALDDLLFPRPLTKPGSTILSALRFGRIPSVSFTVNHRCSRILPSFQVFVSFCFSKRRMKENPK